MNIFYIIDLLKVKNYFKNLIILIPIFFSKSLIDFNLIKELIFIFCILCISASIVYIFNDLIDYKKDKLDTIKKNRPIPSGKIKIRYVVLILILLSFLLSLMLYYKFSYILLYFVIFYFLLNFIYSILLKKFYIIDVICLSSFYILRISLIFIYFNLEFSYWLITILFLVMSSVGFGKRLIDINNNTQNIYFNSIYTHKFLTRALYLLTFFTIVSYLVFSLQESTFHKFGDFFYISSLPFLLGFLRFVYVVKKNIYSEIIDFFLKDWQFLLILIIYFIFNFKLIY